MEIWNLRVELKVGAWNSGRGIFLLNLFRIIGIKMYRMLGLFVYAILFSELFENAKKMFHMEVVWLHAGNLTWYFDFFFYVDVWRGLNANVSFFFKWNYVFFNIASFVTLFEEEFDDYFWSIMYRIFL